MSKNKIKYLITMLLCSVITGVTFGQTDSLSHYLEVAARNNPGVKASFSAYQASLQKIPQAGAIPDPQLDMGFFLQPMEIIDGRQYGNLQVMQMFPWFGTRKAARTEMTHMSRMAFEEFRQSRDNLYLQVYTQWFILCRLQEQLNNNRENKKYLEQLEQLALRKFSASGGKGSTNTPVPSPQPVITSQSSSNSGMSGMGGMGAKNNQSSNRNQPAMAPMGGGMGDNMPASSGMSDVLRIQLEIAEIDNNIESYLSEIKAEGAAFNAIMNRPAHHEVILPDSLTQIPFSLDIASAMDQISEQNPMLGMLVEKGEAFKAKAEMDKKMSYPMIGVGLQYMMIGKRKPMGMGMGMDELPITSMNGKDMIMPMVSLTIPIYRGKYRAQQQESKYWWQASRDEYDNTRNSLEAELYQSKHLLDNATRKIALYAKQSQLAQATYNLITQEFITGKSDLSDVIQVQRQLLDYQLKKAEAIAEYNTMVAGIQKLISFKDDEQAKTN